MKKIVLIGDSIRMGYQPFVAKKLEEAEVWGPTENCRHSLWALDHFKEWVSDQKPDVVHFNFGIHDSSPLTDEKHQIILDQYCLCLQRFIEKTKSLGDVKMIWATTTPLYTPEKGVSMIQWSERIEYEIDLYNSAALHIVKSEGLIVNDLHEVVVKNDFTKCLCEDGCHMTEFGYNVIADAVVKTIRNIK